MMLCFDKMALKANIKIRLVRTEKEVTLMLEAPAGFKAVKSQENNHEAMD